MRFCLLTTFYPPFSFGGDGIFVHRLANALAGEGHHVDVIHCADAFAVMGGAASPGEYRNHPNVRMIALASRAPFLTSLFTQQTGHPSFAKSIRSRIERERYDVIHFHNMSLIGLGALRWGDAVKLYTIHEHWLICPMHILWRFDRECCTRRTCIRCCLAAGRPPQLWRYTGAVAGTLAHLDAFLAPSEFSRKKHLAEMPDIPIVRLPHFSPIPERQPETTGGSPFPDGTYFLFAGRLEKIKGLQTVIPLLLQNPEHRLLIAGEGSYQRTLEEMAAGAANILFLGRQSQQAMASLYRGAIATIVPSVCYETFGLVGVESFAFRTPVIVNKLGALPELVAESGGGLVYEGMDELSAAMSRLAADPPLRRSLGEAGHSAFLARWTPRRHLEEYFSLIDRLKAGRRAPVSAEET